MLVIDIALLEKALKAILPHLPKRIQRLIPAFLECLPLALAVAKLLHKHRREIRDTIENLTERTSKQTKQVSDSIAMTVSRLPKTVGRKLSRLLKYLPLALEIAKASYKKKSQKSSVLNKFPSEEDSAENRQVIKT